MSKQQQRPRVVAYGRWVATPAGFGGVGEARGADLPWEPPTDVYVTENTVTIRMELAGVAPEGIELTCEGRRLRIAGERQRPECYGGPCQFRQAEISYGPFQRVFEFPESLEQADLKATCTDGFLTIEVRPSSPGPRRIAVEHAE